MRRSIASAASAILLGMILLVPRAQADTSFEFLFSSSSVRDDDEYFLHLAVGSYDYPRTVIEPCLPRLRAVEADLPVVLFLASHSGRSVDFIVDLRDDGLAWGVIFSRCGVSYDVLFADIRRDPGPPYGKAWGHWRNNPRELRLSDTEIVGLVQVQTARRVTNTSAFEIARARGDGRPVAAFVADKKGRPHEKAAGKGSKGGGKQGKPGKGNRSS
jgi:hypothetical protein